MMDAWPMIGIGVAVAMMGAACFAIGVHVGLSLFGYSLWLLAKRRATRRIDQANGRFATPYPPHPAALDEALEQFLTAGNGRTK